MRALAPLLVLLVLLAGCTDPADSDTAATDPADTDTADPTGDTIAADPTDPADPTDATAGEPTGEPATPTTAPTTSTTPDQLLATPLGPPPTSQPTEATDATAQGLPADVQRAVVTWVIDGDTIDVEPLEDGDVPAGEQRIRLLEIDTPERDDDCYETATDLLIDIIPAGTEVFLERDVEDTDPNGRYLRYVWTADGELVNLTMVAEGMAEAFIFPLNQLHAPEVRAAEEEAQDLGLGIWGAFCDGRP